MPNWTLADSVQEQYRHITSTPVQYDIRPYLDRVAQIGAIDLSSLSDADLVARAREMRPRARAAGLERLDDILLEVFAIAREASARFLRMRPFDVQLAAG